MKEVSLTKGMVALVSDEDYEKVMQFKWHASQEGHQGLKFYACRFEKDPKHGWKKKIKIRMHRFIMEMPTGFEDPRVVHHKDSDGLNNQKENLEILDCNYWNMLESPGWSKREVKDPFLEELEKLDD